MLCSGDISPGHCDLLRIFDNPNEPQDTDITQLLSKQALKQVAAIIAGKKVNLTLDEARELAKRALKFKLERGRLPSITFADAWEKRMAEGVAFLQRKTVEATNG